MIGRIAAEFPGLHAGNTRITSPEDSAYNCMAWAAGESDRFWWPGADGYWPAGIPREESVTAFESAYGALGYAPCTDGDFESGCEKVAIFVDAQGSPTHAARQIATGC